MKHLSPSAVARALRSPSERALAVLTVGTLLAGLVSAAGVDERVEAATVVGCATGCAEGPPDSRVSSSAAPATTPPRARSAPRPDRRSPTSSPARVTATQKPAPRAFAAAAPRHLVPAGVGRTTAAAMGRVRLTPAGYAAFLRSIDLSYFDYAQRFVEFDPDRVPIKQGPSRVFVWHFTAFYRNADGPSRTPSGRMAIRPFIEGLAERGDHDSPADHVCCGVNWLIDRDGPVHQLAPLNAKLRHNPPYDSINTGVEIEAATQAGITPAQYETVAYLTVAVLDAQRLLGRKPLSEIVKGHGEMRDAFLEDNPDSHWGARGDFDEPESRLLRQVIDAFLKAHPEVLRLRPPLR